MYRKGNETWEEYQKRMQEYRERMGWAKADSEEAELRAEFRPCECNIYGAPPEIGDAAAARILENLAFEIEEEDRMAFIGSLKFPIAEFRDGVNHEFEHGCRDPRTNVTCDDITATGKIALAHLLEDPEYYTRLKKAGIK